MGGFCKEQKKEKADIVFGVEKCGFVKEQAQAFGWIGGCGGMRARWLNKNLYSYI